MPRLPPPAELPATQPSLRLPTPDPRPPMSSTPDVVPLHVAALAATHESAIATRERGCHVRATRNSVRTSPRSPPIASSPPAPTHHIPGAPATGVIWGLAMSSAA